MKFHKYSGSGNDFIFIDGRGENVVLKPSLITKWCARKEGIGADGVILIGDSESCDYSFRIFNSDGSEAEMCGNAARCSIHFAEKVLKLEQKSKSSKTFKFETMNGVYEGKSVGEEVRVKMTELYDVDAIGISDLSGKRALYLNTGVPHAVIQVSSVEDVNIQAIGSAIRHDVRFPSGTNVDFFEVLDDDKKIIKLRVYERGVEGETLCCGTGIMATAVSCSKFFGWTGEIQVYAKGGRLTAIVDRDLKELYFQGEVECIYSGELWVRD